MEDAVQGCCSEPAEMSAGAAPSHREGELAPQHEALTNVVSKGSASQDQLPPNLLSEPRTCRTLPEQPAEAVEKAAAVQQFSVYLFDWDDTLLPTTALGDKALSPHSLPEATRRALRRIDTLGSDALRAAVAPAPGNSVASRVIILTNACEAWVQRTAKLHLPRVHGLLAKQGGPITIVSARPQHLGTQLQVEPAPRGASALVGGDFNRRLAEVAEWKRDAVRSMASSLREWIHGLSAGKPRLQVFGVGDMAHDLDAAYTLAGELREVCLEVLIKTVRFRARPPPATLAAQLDALTGLLAELYRRPMGVGCELKLMRSSSGKGEPGIFTCWNKDVDESTLAHTGIVGEDDQDDDDTSSDVEEAIGDLPTKVAGTKPAGYAGDGTAMSRTFTNSASAGSRSSADQHVVQLQRSIRQDTTHSDQDDVRVADLELTQGLLQTEQRSASSSTSPAQCPSELIREVVDGRSPSLVEQAPLVSVTPKRTDVEPDATLCLEEITQVSQPHVREAWAEAEGDVPDEEDTSDEEVKDWNPDSDEDAETTAEEERHLRDGPARATGSKRHLGQ